MSYSIKLDIKINVPLSVAWNAWAEAGIWSQWVFMKMSNNFILGGEYSNGNNEGGKYLKIIPHKLISFSWNMNNYEPGSYVDVCFEKFDKNFIVCSLHHKNLKSIKNKKDAELGWRWAMNSLKNYLETGQGVQWEQWKT